MTEGKRKQIASELREGIRAGKYPVGSMLPSRGALADMFNVASGTAQYAVRILVKEGLVRAVQGRGATVISNRIVRTPTQLRHDDLMAELHALRRDIEKYWDMAERDGYLHLATISSLPNQVFRVMLAVHRLSDVRSEEEAR